MEAAKGTCVRQKGSQRRRHGHYLTKTLLPLWSPYDRTVFLDGDTVICGSVDKLFEAPLTLTAFAGWQTNGRKIGGRISRYKGISPIIDEWVDELRKNAQPAINTGVIGWHKGDLQWARLWNYVTYRGPGCIGDELAMQIIFNRVGATVLDDRYNCSAMHGQHKDKVVIWHFHGDKHLKKEPGKSIWIPYFNLAMEENFAGLKEWAGTYDPWVKRYFAELKEQAVCQTT
jgi:hypothetical protein